MKKTVFRNVFLSAIALLAAVALVAGCAKAPAPREIQVIETVVVEKEVLAERPPGEPMPTPAPAVETAKEGTQGSGEPGSRRWPRPTAPTA